MKNLNNGYMKISEFRHSSLVGNQTKTDTVYYKFDSEFYKKATHTDMMDMLKHFEIELKPFSGRDILSKEAGYWYISGTGDIDLSNQGLSSLPMYFSDYGIKGNFNISFNNLTDLIGCPFSVYNFNCSNNKIKQLIMGPQEFFDEQTFKSSDNPKLDVKRGIYNCSNNKLTSLVGVPYKMMVLNCDGNPGKFTIEDLKMYEENPHGRVTYKFIGHNGTYLIATKDYIKEKYIEYNHIVNKEQQKALLKERRHKLMCERLGIEHIPLYKIREQQLNSTMTDVFGACRQHEIELKTKFQNAMDFDEVENRLTENNKIIYKDNKLTIGENNKLLYCKINEINRIFYWNI